MCHDCSTHPRAPSTPPRAAACRGSVHAAPRAPRRAPADGLNGCGTELALGATAWQTILSTNVLSYLDYATIRVLTDAYDSQQRLREQLRGLGDLLPVAVGAYFVGESQVRAQLLVTLTLADLIYAEQGTLCAYDRVFAKVGGAPAGWRSHDCATATSAAPRDAHDSRGGGASRRP